MNEIVLLLGFKISLFEDFNLVQHLQGSTHTSGHNLDLVITRQGEEPVKNVRVTDPVISDDSVVHWETSCLKKAKLREAGNEISKITFSR